MENSKWTLEAKILSEDKNGKWIRIQLITQPIPQKQITQLEVVVDPHPFYFLGEEYFDESLNNHHVEVRKSVLQGKYHTYVADNPVTRSIVDMLADPKKLDKGSGTCQWSWYRAKLVRLLDSLWD